MNNGHCIWIEEGKQVIHISVLIYRCNYFKCCIDTFCHLIILSSHEESHQKSVILSWEKSLFCLPIKYVGSLWQFSCIHWFFRRLLRASPNNNKKHYQNIARTRVPRVLTPPPPLVSHFESFYGCSAIGLLMDVLKTTTTEIGRRTRTHIGVERAVGACRTISADNWDEMYGNGGRFVSPLHRQDTRDGAWGLGRGSKEVVVVVKSMYTRMCIGVDSGEWWWCRWWWQGVADGGGR